MAGRPSLPQFEGKYDEYKMRAFVDDFQRWFRSIESDIQGTSATFDGVHNDINGRDAADAHQISAITGLQSALNGKASVASVASNTALIAGHETRITDLENEALATFAQRVDDTTASTIYFFGEAQPGVVDLSALWRIQRITFITPGQDDVDIEWADGNSNFDNVWDDRLILAYS